MKDKPVHVAGGSTLILDRPHIKLYKFDGSDLLMFEAGRERFYIDGCDAIALLNILTKYVNHCSCCTAAREAYD